MEFKINVTKFLTNLTPVIDVATKNTVKDFEGAYMVSLEATNDGLNLVAHGGNACIKTQLSNAKIDKLDYNCVTEGSSVVEAKKLITTLTSFPPNKEISVKISTKTNSDGEDAAGEMEVTCDGTEMQAMPISKKQVSPPVIAKSFSIEMNVNREIFLAGMQKVNFAVGVEEHRSKYLSQIFDATKDEVKFIAGNGARFAIDKISGKSITTSDKEQRMVFPKNNIQNILASLKSSASEQICIKEGLATKENSDQIIIEFDDTVLVILGVDLKIKDSFPDINKIIDFDHPYQFKFDINDWIYPTKGTRATFSDEMKTDSLIHNAEIEADIKKNRFIVKTDTNMKSKRTVKVETIKSQDDAKNIYLCNSLYLAEMVNQGYDSGNIIMRMIDQDKPIVVDYPELENGSKGTNEKYSIFFTTSKKK